MAMVLRITGDSAMITPKNKIFLQTKGFETLNALTNNTFHLCADVADSISHTQALVATITGQSVVSVSGWVIRFVGK